MALSDYLKRGQIGPSLKGQFYQYERNGRWVTAKWPKKRGKPKSEKQALAQQAFANVCRAMKKTAAEIQMYHRENAKGTPMLPRDSLMAALYGNGPTLNHYSKKVIKPMSNKLLASTVLDAIGWQKGDILYRGDDTWEVLPPGPYGYVLTSSGLDDVPVWAAPTGGPGAGLVAQTVSSGTVRMTAPMTMGIGITAYGDLEFTKVKAVLNWTGPGIVQCTLAKILGNWTIKEIVATSFVPTPFDSGTGLLTFVFPPGTKIPTREKYCVFFSRTGAIPSASWGTLEPVSGWIGGPVLFLSTAHTLTKLPAAGDVVVHTGTTNCPWVRLEA